MRWPAIGAASGLSLWRAYPRHKHFRLTVVFPRQARSSIGLDHYNRHESGEGINRINRSEAGTCPVVAVGISGATWDGTEYPE